MTVKKKIKKPTTRQRKAAQAHVDNFLSGKPISTGSMLKSVGYGTGLQNQPARVLESVGFKQAIRDMGLTEELITTSLVEDIKNKPQKRVAELKLGSEILGIVRNDEKPPSEQKNTYNFIFSQEVQSKVHDINEEIKKTLTRNADVQKD